MRSTLLLLVSHHLHIFASSRCAQIVHALLQSILLLHSYWLFLDATLCFYCAHFWYFSTYLLLPFWSCYSTHLILHFSICSDWFSIKTSCKLSTQKRRNRVTFTPEFRFCLSVASLIVLYFICNLTSLFQVIIYQSVALCSTFYHTSSTFCHTSLCLLLCFAVAHVTP